MCRFFVGLIITIAIALWGGVVIVHAGSLNIEIILEITSQPTDPIPTGVFHVTNNEQSLAVKGFAVEIGNGDALSASILFSPSSRCSGGKWSAITTNTAPITDLPGSAGGTGPGENYVSYTEADDDPANYLPPGSIDDCPFAFTIFRLPKHFLPYGIIAVDASGHEVTCVRYSEDEGCEVLANSITALGPGTFWIGLKNSDDQGTQFDLRAQVFINNNATPIAEGVTRCITGVTRNPNNAKEVTVPFGLISNGDFNSGDILSLKIFTRIGTNTNDTKCSGPGGSHNNAVGLRLYYNAANRSSQLAVATTTEPLQDFYLHSTSTKDFLDNTAPAPTAPAQFKDSAGVNFASGNPWQFLGSWSRTLDAE